MNTEELILEYLKFHPSKSCTILSMTLLFQHYSINSESLIEAIHNLYLQGDVYIVEKDHKFLTEIKLIPKLSLI